MAWMKRVGLAAALGLAAVLPVWAEPVTVALSDEEQATWAAMAEAFERCVGAATVRGETALCRNVHAVVAGFAGKVAAAKSPPKPAEAAK